MFICMCMYCILCILTSVWSCDGRGHSHNWGPVWQESNEEGREEIRQLTRIHFFLYIFPWKNSWLHIFKTVLSAYRHLPFQQNSKFGILDFCQTFLWLYMLCSQPPYVVRYMAPWVIIFQIDSSAHAIDMMLNLLRQGFSKITDTDFEGPPLYLKFVLISYLEIVWSQLEPWSFGLTPSPKVEGVRSWSSQLPLRRILTDRDFAHRRIQVFSPSCRQGKRWKEEQDAGGKQIRYSNTLKLTNQVTLPYTLLDYKSQNCHWPYAASPSLSPSPCIHPWPAGESVLHPDLHPERERPPPIETERDMEEMGWTLIWLENVLVTATWNGE